MTIKSSCCTGSDWRYVALFSATYAFAACFSLWLVSFATEEVFITGDGGVKLLAVRSILSGHSAIELQMPAMEPWVREAWDQGYFPSGFPHIHTMPDGRVLYNFSPLFPVVTALFYEVFGYRGLYVVPMLSLWAFWIAFLYFLYRLDVHPLLGWLAFIFLIFAFPWTMYGAMYWEHMPAVSLAFIAVVLLLTAVYRNTCSLLTGSSCALLLSLSAGLRAEQVVFALLIGGAWVSYSTLQAIHGNNRLLRGGIAFLVSMLLMFASLAAFNLNLFGDYRGAQFLIQQFPEKYEEYVFVPWTVRLETLSGAVIANAPLALVIYPILATVFYARHRRIDSECMPAPLLAITVFSALLLASFFMLALLFVHDLGIFTWQPRYLLAPLAVAYLALILVINFQLRRYVPDAPGRRIFIVFAAICIASGIWGSYSNSVKGTTWLQSNYQNRVAPALRAIADHHAVTLITNDPATIQEMASLANTHHFLRHQTPEQFFNLVDFLMKKQQTHFLYVRASFDGTEHLPDDFTIETDRWELTVSLLGHYGWYWSIYELTLIHVDNGNPANQMKQAQ